MTDTIFFFSKKKGENVFHRQYTECKDTTRFKKVWHSTSMYGRKQLLVYNMEKVKKACVDLSKYDEIVEVDSNEMAILGNMWNDINFLRAHSKERTGYPTQKPSKLYRRLIESSSNQGQIVLDPFAGSQVQR